MMRILVLGSTGMLGHMILKVLTQEKEWEVVGTQSQDPNGANYFRVEDSPSAFRRTVLGVSWDYLINCIGVLAPVEDMEQAIRVNALFPHELARAVQSKIIHMSTDGVFSGRPSHVPPPLTPPTKGGESPFTPFPPVGEGRGEGYTEDSPHDCTDVYGKTKSLGEVVADNVLNIRTSIIGPSPYKKKGLLEWFLAQPDGATVQGYINHVWNGVTTLQFAQLCAKIIKEDAFERLRVESRVFHFAPNEPVTKYELLEIFKNVFGKNVNVERTEDHRGPVERVLKTKYEGLKKFLPHDMKMEEAVNELKQSISSP